MEVRTMSKSAKRLKEEYEAAYGNIPSDNDPDGQLQYLCDNYGINPSKYTELVKRLVDGYSVKNCSIDLPLIPMAAKRPRSSPDGHFYVEGAATHRKLVQDMIDFNGIIYTTCKVDICICVPIPYSSMTKEEIYLAHLGLIRPLNEDWDNFAKTYCDSIQNLIIINDNIIVDGRCRKFYSVKPHVTIDIEYATHFDSKFNQRKITKSKSYERNYERVKMDEYTASGLPDQERKNVSGM